MELRTGTSVGPRPASSAKRIPVLAGGEKPGAAAVRDTSEGSSAGKPLREDEDCDKSDKRSDDPKRTRLEMDRPLNVRSFGGLALVERWLASRSRSRQRVELVVERVVAGAPVLEPD